MPPNIGVRVGINFLYQHSLFFLFCQVNKHTSVLSQINFISDSQRLIACEVNQKENSGSCRESSSLQLNLNLKTYHKELSILAQKYQERLTL